MAHGWGGGCGGGRWCCLWEGCCRHVLERDGEQEERDGLRDGARRASHCAEVLVVMTMRRPPCSLYPQLPPGILVKLQPEQAVYDIAR